MVTYNWWQIYDYSVVKSDSALIWLKKVQNQVSNNREILATTSPFFWCSRFCDVSDFVMFQILWCFRYFLMFHILWCFSLEVVDWKYCESRRCPRMEATYKTTFLRWILFGRRELFWRHVFLHKCLHVSLNTATIPIITMSYLSFSYSGPTLHGHCVFCSFGVGDILSFDFA